MKVIHAPLGPGSGFEKIIYGDNSSALSILLNPDGGWRTRHLRLRSSCLRELLKTDPQGWKARHQKGTELPADMLTKPIVLLKDWVKFWTFLGIQVDPTGGKSVGENSISASNQGVEDYIATSSVKTAAAMAALAALTVAAVTTQQLVVRRACAAAASTCAVWLAGSSTHGFTSQKRSNVICCDGREVEQLKRATGQRKNEGFPPRDDEPGGKRQE